MRLVDYSKCRATTEATASEDVEHSLTSFHVFTDNELSPRPKRRSSATSACSRSLQAILEARQSTLSPPAFDTTCTFGSLNNSDSAISIPSATSPIIRRNTVGCHRKNKASQATATRRASMPPFQQKQEGKEDRNDGMNASLKVVVSPTHTDGANSTEAEPEMEVIEVQLAPPLETEDKTDDQSVSSLANLHDSQQMLDNSQIDHSSNEQHGSLKLSSSTLSNLRRRKMTWLANQTAQKILSSKNIYTESGPPPLPVVKVVYPQQQQQEEDATKRNKRLEEKRHHGMSPTTIIPETSFVDEAEEEDNNSDRWVQEKSLSLQVLPDMNDKRSPQPASVVMTKSVRRSSSSFVAGSQIKTYHFQ